MPVDNIALVWLVYKRLTRCRADGILVKPIATRNVMAIYFMSSYTSRDVCYHIHPFQRRVANVPVVDPVIDVVRKQRLCPLLCSGELSNQKTRECRTESVDLRK